MTREKKKIFLDLFSFRTKCFRKETIENMNPYYDPEWSVLPPENNRRYAKFIVYASKKLNHEICVRNEHLFEQCS